jgi:DNA-binding transcriptional LysR family regulator
MDRLLSMRVFERVVDEGSFAAAARALDLSPPVVTRLVADLEEHLGTRLLQRSTRRLALTEAGQTYLGRVRSILQDIDEAHALASASTRELAGLLRLHAQRCARSWCSLSRPNSPMRKVLKSAGSSHAAARRRRSAGPAAANLRRLWMPSSVV